MITHTAYIFPGQGSQAVGMGRALAEAYASSAEVFAETDAILGFALSRLCFEGPVGLLSETANTQPAILATSIAAWRALHARRPELPAPCCVAGHSLGEYSALVIAGALSFADAVRLTRLRGQLMAGAGGEGDAARRGSMAAILKLDDAHVEALCQRAADDTQRVVQVANYNAPGQVVISGDADGVVAVVELARAAGGRPRMLAVSVAAHSALMAPATEALASAIADVSIRTPEVPVVGNVGASYLTDPDSIRRELVAQLVSPVRWTASMQLMAAAGAGCFVEVGPGEVLTGLAKRIVPEASTANVRTPEDVEIL